MSRPLVLEDRKKPLHNPQRILEKKGHELTRAVTSEQGFLAAATAPIDAASLATLLLDPDGLRVLRDLRGNGSRRFVPFGVVLLDTALIGRR